MYSPAARNCFSSELPSLVADKRTFFPLSQSYSKRSLRSSPFFPEKCADLKFLRRHKSLPNINHNNVALTPINQVSSLYTLDSNLQLMKVIQERDRLNLELVKMQKMNKNLMSSLACEKENFQKSKEKLFDVLNVEKIREQLKKIDNRSSSDNKCIEEWKLHISDRDKLVEELKSKCEQMSIDLECKQNEIDLIKSKSVEKGALEELQLQVEKLERQLSRARETSMNERKIAKECQTDLWKKEKELKDLKIDLRIAHRNLKTAEETIKKINQEGYEYVANALKDKENLFKEEKENLKDEIKKLQIELESAQAEISQEKASNASIKSNLMMTETELEEVKYKVQKLEYKLQSSQSKLEACELQLKKVQAELANKKLNNEALKSTCKEMDEQLDNYEKLNEDLQERIGALVRNIKDLHEELSKVMVELKQCQIEANEERALHSSAKTQLNQLAKKVEELEKEIIEWKDRAQVIEKQFMVTETELVEMKERCLLLEEDVDKFQCHSDLLTNEVICLKEERSQFLTQIYDERDQKRQLEEKIRGLEDDNSCFQSTITELQERISDLEKSYSQKEIKYESTLQQQTKLIDFLQNHIDGLKKKKRTLAEKLLKSPNKENIDRKFLAALNTDFQTPLNAQKKALSLGKDARLRSSQRNFTESKKWTPAPLKGKIVAKNFNYETTLVDKNLGKSASSTQSSSNTQPTAIVQNKENESVTKYRGEILHMFESVKNLHINCMEQINKSLYLLGCNEGLYSLHILPNNKKQLVKIVGVSLIQQISLLKKLDLALLIAGETSSMMMCNLRQLMCNAEAAECAKPSIKVQHLYDHIKSAYGIATSSKFDGSQLCNCYTFAVSPCNSYLCVSSAGCVMFFLWKKSSFQLVKQIKSELPVSWFSFLSKSVFFSSDQIFEVELKSGYFTITQFLNESDKSMSYLTSRSRSGPYPMAVFEISLQKEYLICFDTCGVFVNTFGRRSRDDDIKWNHVPVNFVYSEPLLTIVHLSSISVTKILPSVCIRQSSGSSSTINTPDAYNVEFTSLRLLGTNYFSSKVFLSDRTVRGIDLIAFSATSAFRDDPDVSLSAISSAISSSSGFETNDGELNRELEALDLSTDFSFSSSLVRSLENLNATISSGSSISLPSIESIPTKSGRQVRFKDLHTAV